MALKLDRAQNEAGIFAAHEVDGDDGPFECPVCHIPVGHVIDHVRHGDDLRLRRHVPAYFRRYAGYEHGRCPYNVAGVIDGIFRDATAVEDKLPVFDREGGSYRFRLNIATALAEHMRPGTWSKAQRIGSNWLNPSVLLIETGYFHGKISASLSTTTPGCCVMPSRSVVDTRSRLWWSSRRSFRLPKAAGTSSVAHQVWPVAIQSGFLRQFLLPPAPSEALKLASNI